MTRLVTIEQLLEKPICMMSGQEFVLLLQNAEKQTAKVPAEVVLEKHYEYGIAGIAKIFGCSIPTANRIKKSGVIDAAITQVNRKITVDSELEAEANAVQLNHSSIHNDPILDDIRLYLERMVPRAYTSWSIPMRAAYQKGAYTESSPDGKPEVLLNMVCPRQIIEELPNDLVRRNPAKYTAQYINRLMSLVDGWERSEQEKVKGLHPAYCDKTGRAKHPWVRIGNATQSLIEGKEESIEPELPF